MTKRSYLSIEMADNLIDDPECHNSSQIRIKTKMKFAKSTLEMKMLIGRVVLSAWYLISMYAEWTRRMPPPFQDSWASTTRSSLSELLSELGREGLFLICKF